jgi:hypothetical protein
MTDTTPPTLLQDLQDAIRDAGAEAEQVGADAEGPYSRDAAAAYIEGLNAARALAERHAEGLHREVTVRPAYDCIEVQPCALGSERCATLEAGTNHGRGDAVLHLALFDRLREVRVAIDTGWYHPATPADIVGRVNDIRRAPRFPELAFHSTDPMPGAVGPVHAGEHCPRGWDECWSATFASGADEALPLLVAQGLDAVWAWMENQWCRQFGTARADA